MVTVAGARTFYAEAHRMAISLTASALRHGGQATWLADACREDGAAWRRITGTLSGELAAGTAGVALFLAETAALSGEPGVRDVAREAAAHALARATELEERGRRGWYAGTAGVAWAAGRVATLLGDPRLHDGAVALARRTVAAGAAAPVEWAGAPGLWRGTAGDLAGLLALAPLVHGMDVRTQADRRAEALLALVDDGAEEGPADDVLPVGLANGWSGVGVALLAWSAATGETAGLHAAGRALAHERGGLDSETGLWSGPGHPWTATPATSWCSGAAGIGLARLAAWHVTRDVASLAEAGAALQAVRREAEPPADDSVCHGATGSLELLRSAGRWLGEPSHTAAAERLGQWIVGRALRRRGYAAGVGPGSVNATLWHGLAGTGLALLRLAEARVPGTTLPPPFT